MNIDFFVSFLLEYDFNNNVRGTITHCLSLTYQLHKGTEATDKIKTFAN